MRLVAFSDRLQKENLRWASLPALCCQAAGGKPENALPVAAAWYLFNLAAGIMDKVQDNDPPAEWWAESGSGVALSVSTGLYFSANLALNNLENTIGSSLTCHQVRKEILSKFLEMGAGQHMDIIHPYPNLEQYWQIASAKSGSFFGLACWAGARIATRQLRKLQGYHQFGMNVGLLIQVLDDLHDYLQLSQSEVDPGDLDLKRSLPAVYIREVAPEHVKDRFESLVNSKMSTTETGQIIEIIEQFGGSQYLFMELDRLYHSAIKGLDQAGADEPARGQLVDLLHELHSD